jgi:potassium efflux system protein
VHMPWLRAVGWILVAVTAIALIAGYIGFAAFLLSRFLVLLAMVGALYVAAVFVDALFSDVLAGSAPGGRRFAAMVGLTPRGVDLIGTLLAGIIKIALALIAIFPVIGPWGVFAADFFGVVQDAMFGFRVGEITISLGAVLGAMAILFAGVMATRFLQRWLDSRFLPQTSLDPGLQNSVSALVGYAGIIAVLVFVLAELGIDLQKIAIIAGALSVGVGFGLQSIVSNFVSGLILLAERPIRVGDWVVVKNDEGFVRRISVRRQKSKRSIAPASSFRIRNSSPGWSRTGPMPIQWAVSR